MKSLRVLKLGLRETAKFLSQNQQSSINILIEKKDFVSFRFLFFVITFQLSFFSFSFNFLSVFLFASFFFAFFPSYHQAHFFFFLAGPKDTSPTIALEKTFDEETLNPLSFKSVHHKETSIQEATAKE